MTQSTLDRRAVLAAMLGLPLTACGTLDPAIIDGILGAGGGLGALSQFEAAKGIRAALANGVVSAITQVGHQGGYFNDGKIQIPLPRDLQNIHNFLSQIGAGGLLDDLKLALNRGAERAAPHAKALFVDVISGVSISDAINIVRGSNNAATRYLAEATTPRLVSLFSPVMTDALQGTGALQLFDQMAGNMRNVPFAPQLGADAKAGLIEHGVRKGLGGLFHYIGEQEAAIRANPAERTSEILRRVFGGAYA
ncbi:MAG: DUF4197 domain-containing protein [Robiginitomaculum sp.]